MHVEIPYDNSKMLDTYVIICDIREKDGNIIATITDWDDLGNGIHEKPDYAQKKLIFPYTSDNECLKKLKTFINANKNKLRDWCKENVIPYTKYDV